MKTSIVLGSGGNYNFDKIIISLSDYVNNNLKSSNSSYEIGVILNNDYYNHYKNIMIEDDYYVGVLSRLLDMVGNVEGIKNHWEINGDNGGYIMKVDDNIPFYLYVIDIVKDILSKGL